jgi:hypothetical protein
MSNVPGIPFPHDWTYEDGHFAHGLVADLLRTHHRRAAHRPRHQRRVQDGAYGYEPPPACEGALNDTLLPALRPAGRT